MTTGPIDPLIGFIASSKPTIIISALVGVAVPDWTWVKRFPGKSACATFLPPDDDVVVIVIVEFTVIDMA
jgi:hypothetical protein